jgi:hypothetical protein
MMGVFLICAFLPKPVKALLTLKEKLHPSLLFQSLLSTSIWRALDTLIFLTKA